MNEIFLSLGILSWKPLLTALVLPPVPGLLLLFISVFILFWRRWLGWILVFTALTSTWLLSTSAVAGWLEGALLAPPAALEESRISEIQRQVRSGRRMAIVVLGAGRQSIAPEYGQSTLTAASLLRLHYAIWLSRRTGAPILFSGGIGHGQTDGPSEAEIAARIAERDYQRPLRWIETGSRDTRENAVRSVSMLERENLSEIILVTHGWHMRRSLKVFQWSVDRQGGAINLTPAPMDLGRRDISPVLRWIPSSEGISLGRSVWREAIGLWVGA